MKRHFLFHLLFFGLLLSLSLYSFSQNPVKTKKAVINAREGWQNTGVTLRSDQYYSVSAWGAWASGFTGNSYGPEGIGHGTIGSNALVGWIAVKQPEKLGYKSYTKEIIGNIIYIGKEGFFKSYADGILWLSMGEFSGCKECSGQVEVLITIYE
jgi:hypothetical protein